MSVPIFPTVNASLNFLAGVFLFLGYKAVKRHDVDMHRKFMISALVCSGLFLACYLTYHFFHGSTKYTGEGFVRIVYFTILLTHTVLAALIVPFIAVAVYVAFKGNIQKHVRIVRWVFPTWMYVSVTGVVIYVMLYLL